MKRNNEAIALAVVIRNCKVLIQHRFRSNQGMVYEFPGGSADPGESFEDAAVRELEEETGLQECTVTRSLLKNI